MRGLVVELNSSKGKQATGLRNSAPEDSLAGTSWWRTAAKYSS